MRIYIYIYLKYPKIIGKDFILRLQKRTMGVEMESFNPYLVFFLVALAHLARLAAWIISASAAGVDQFDTSTRNGTNVESVFDAFFRTLHVITCCVSHNGRLQPVQKDQLLRHGLPDPRINTIP